MEINKLRYNIYDYLLFNNTYFNLANDNIYFYKFFLIFIYFIFIIIIIFDYNKINFISLLFLFIYTLFIYFIILFDNKINYITNNEYLKNYMIYYKLFNSIFIDSYNTNYISIYVNTNNINPNDLLDIINIYKKINNNSNILINYKFDKIDENTDKYKNIISIYKQINNNNITNLSHSIYTNISEYTFKINNIYNDNYLELFINNNNNIFIIINYKNDNTNSNINNINNFCNLYIQQNKNNNIIIDDYFNSKYIININNLLLEYIKSNHLTEINNNLIKYLNSRTIYTNFINNNFKNNYISSFYETLKKIYMNIKFNENIIDEKIYDFSYELIKNNNILKYIDVYDNQYYLLKKYIFIKIDLNNQFHNFLHNNYETNKDNFISLIDKNKIKIIDVILNITNLYNNNNYYYLIDIETINTYFNKKGNNITNINNYIIEIFNYLLLYYNSKLNLELENFDILYKNNNVVDEKILEELYKYNNYFNNVIIIIIIFLTINLHIFYIKYYKNIINYI
jgi:hypothetical protein